MAFRARLSPPQPARLNAWPWHRLQCGVITANQVASGDMRMEAETYLSTGFGIRKSIEKGSGWGPFDELARAWAPPRIKQIVVDPEFGVPYLNTSQVFDTRPSPRKWLAFSKTSKAKDRLAKQGTILVMASASPGRTTLVTVAHENAFISHHFMRIDPINTLMRGWIYGFLISRQGHAMLSGSQYASIIRHIEPHHVHAIPVPPVTRQIAADFAEQFDELLRLRNRSFQRAEEADRLFADAIGNVKASEKQIGFVVRSSDIMESRRQRLEGNYFSPEATLLLRKFKKWEPLSELSERVWWLSRFKRFYGDGGLP